MYINRLRIGSLVCPMVVVDLVRNCQQELAISLFTIVPLIAGVAILFFHVETMGKPLSDMVEQDPLVRK